MRDMTLLFLAFFLGTEAFAVPVPWINCGAPGDIVSVQQLNASVWPPQNPGPTGPLFASAKVDPDDGDVERLRAVLFPFNWVFELNKNIHGHVKNGFVSLPASWLVNGSPPMHVETENFRALPDLGPIQGSHLHGYLDELPVPAGPFNNTDTFPFNDPNPFILSVRANIGQPIPFMNASFWITYNGVSGFPIQPQAGGVYSYHLKVTEPSGTGVFCMNVSEPIKFAQTMGAQVERVPFGGIHIESRKSGTVLTWTYGEHHEAIASSAMEPDVELQSCPSGGTGSRTERAEPFYDPESGIWSVRLDEDETDCTEVLIRSALTGQVDGPFKLDE